MYNYFLFDLDGTLTDPGLGITNSVAYALGRFGIDVTDRTTLYKFIGPPLLDSFQEFYEFSEEQSEAATEYYREYFREKGIYENFLYDGVEELLTKLKEQNKTMILATSKPEEFAIKILQHFGIDKYFDFVAAATMDGTRRMKSDIIQYALEHCQISDVASAVMVGDREYDIKGANKNGIDSIGVLFGYGSREELENAGAKFIVDAPLKVLDYM